MKSFFKKHPLIFSMIAMFCLSLLSNLGNLWMFSLWGIARMVGFSVVIPLVVYGIIRFLRR